ncbi:MAG TPA: transposase [Actinomycetota bacterium]|nr:transposase [Actinomycetota bacterium]
MTLGRAQRQLDILDENRRFCEKLVGEKSVYALLQRERDQLFPDEMFADLFAKRGRCSIPPCVVAVVMVLQKAEGLSDREAVESLTFDLRWKYAAGVEGFQEGFVHTVLVNMRARLRDSADPHRIFRVSKEVAGEAGLIGLKRVLDSTPLYDAVATQDTVTLIRSAIRGLLRVADDELEAQIRRYLRRDDDYARAGKPTCDWDDPEAREAMIDDLVRDGLEALRELEGRTLTEEVGQAAELLATVIGQDIEQTGEGVFRIARRTAPDRVISTVDPEARHGRKSSAHGFDGFKGHMSIDPDSEIITAAEVGDANKGDGEMMPELLEEFAPAEGEEVPGPGEPVQPGAPADDPHNIEPPSASADKPAPLEPGPAVYGDSAYGGGASLALLEQMGVTPMVKVQEPHARGGCFTKDRFVIDLAGAVVTCPNNVTVALRPLNDGGGHASFGKACSGCPLRARCTTARDGRVISVGVHEALLQEARRTQTDPTWQADYKSTRPKVERKQAHCMRRRHGGRRARVRGKVRVDQDFKLLAAAGNFARLAVLGVASTAGTWAAASI